MFKVATFAAHERLLNPVFAADDETALRFPSHYRMRFRVDHADLAGNLHHTAVVYRRILDGRPEVGRAVSRARQGVMPRRRASRR